MTDLQENRGALVVVRLGIAAAVALCMTQTSNKAEIDQKIVQITLSASRGMKVPANLCPNDSHSCSTRIANPRLRAPQRRPNTGSAQQRKKRGRNKKSRAEKIEQFAGFR
jgi:hypothetical protein